MYNVLITDDEQIMIDSLEFIINKNFADEIKLFKASSGTEALEITNREKIDIVFMDINMPGMTGLETVNCILRLKPDTVVIMLSAFDRFQYAQEAMNLGAFKYITKPVNRNVLIENVHSAMNLVDERRGRLSDDMELHKKLDIVSPMVESDFIYSCIFSGGNNSDLSTYLDYFSIEEKNWCFACLEVPAVDRQNQFDLYNQIHQLLHTHIRCLIGSLMINRLVIYFPVKEKSMEYQQIVKDELKKIFTLLSVNISRGMRMGVSRIENDASLMVQHYNEALNALNKTLQDGGIEFSQDEGMESSENSEKPEEVLQRLYNRLRIGDGAGVRFLVNTYCQRLSENSSSLDLVKNSLFELLVNAQNITRELKTDYKNDAFSGTFMFLSKAGTIYEMEEFVQKRLMECVTVICTERQQKENPIVKKACDYIAAHLAENISLETTADAVEVSSFYLSKLFKEEKGTTFITYLTDLRLNSAKQQLSETGLSIKEITAAVGYNDQNYFSKLFKNKFGLSPTEFRNSKN